jgi:hypothetical protein
MERDKTEKWLNQHGWWPSPGARPEEVDPGDYSYLMTDEQFANQERVKWKVDQFQKCLLKKKFLGARDIYTVKPTSLTLEWGELETEVEIEISRYGNLAAVFTYGEVGLHRNASKDIDDCLKSCGLIRLTDDEIEELQQQGVHYLLF